MQSDYGERFEVRRRLGAGSFGVVYEAFDRERDRLVAIKVLENAAPDTIARFKREFRYLAEIRHPNLASMYELAVIGEHWLLTMELVPGTDLLEHLAIAEMQHALRCTPRQPTVRIPPEASEANDTLVPFEPIEVSSIYIGHVRDYFAQLALGAAALHAAGVVHRDIKPSNIMITTEGRVVLLDFGLVIEIALEDTIDRKTVVGTPGYMSPEQITGTAPTAAGDWYSFGVILFQALTGRMPFTGQSAIEILERQLHSEAPFPSASVRGIPGDLDALCHELLQSDPAKRPSQNEIFERLGVEGFSDRVQEREHRRSHAPIGREREVRALTSELARVVPGKPRVILLQGSPGVGKSTLADRFLDAVRDSGQALILGGRCHAWESLPLNAVDSIVDSLVRSLRRERPQAVDQAMSRSVALGRVFPALSVESSIRFDDETMVIPTGERLIVRATKELSSILAAAAGDRRLVIMLDDVQWGDFASARVVERILSGLESHGVLLLLACRTEDWRTSLFLQYLKGLVRVREISLRDFGQLNSRRLIASISDDLPGKKTISRIVRESGGNLMLIDMLTRHAMSGGAPPAEGSLLAGAIRSRLARLSVPARALFELLLVTPDPVEESHAARALELFDMDEPLRTLSRERLIRSRLTGPLHEIDLYHPRMRSVRSELLSQSKGRMLEQLLDRARFAPARKQA